MSLTALLFLLFTAVMALGIVGFTARFLDNKTVLTTGLTLLTWLIYVGLLSYLGVVRNPNLRPPGVLFVFGPLALFLILFIARALGVSKNFPLWLLIGAQSFRVIVEIFLHQLWVQGIVPQMLTFEGANIDIYIGASALLIAWWSGRGRIGLRIGRIWNILGLLALANVVARAVLTTPGRLNLIHTEVPNMMIGTFPYTFIPGLMVPLAVVLHVLALRKIGQQVKVVATRKDGWCNSDKLVS